ncbi:hypothetical protein L1987_47762 [Smallanthus sonchifolius]|uniref:Uncharacterized protein n=1 Tax=Smallanthus sonchifolius TaxID=185202 RepID=A0ACB9FR13_9ASTR|nr:hypothetical protein L1987_47762 [Smallanthus sonchifolius]
MGLVLLLRLGWGRGGTLGTLGTYLKRDGKVCKGPRRLVRWSHWVGKVIWGLWVGKGWLWQVRHMWTGKRWKHKTRVSMNGTSCTQLITWHIQGAEDTTATLKGTKVSRTTTKNKWKQNDSAKRVFVKLEWEKRVPGIPMYDVVSKLKQLKKPLRKLSFGQGEVVAGPLVADQFISHFKAVLGSSSPVLPISNPASLFSRRISAISASFMEREVTDAEIKSAMSDIDDNKASGPDVVISGWKETGVEQELVWAAAVSQYMRLVLECPDWFFGPNSLVCVGQVGPSQGGCWAVSSDVKREDTRSGPDSSMQEANQDIRVLPDVREGYVEADDTTMREKDMPTGNLLNKKTD